MNPSNNDFETNSKQPNSTNEYSDKETYQEYRSLVKKLEKLNAEDSETKDSNDLEKPKPKIKFVEQKMTEKIKIKLILPNSSNQQTDHNNYQPKEINDMKCLSCKIGIESLENAKSRSFCNECELIMWNNFDKMLAEHMDKS